jgi:hypothetical protein
MRQFFTFRFWLSIVAVAALLGVLYLNVRDADVGKPAQAGGPAERKIDTVTRVIAARLDPGWTVRDGVTVGSAEIETGYGATLTIKPGTYGELQCEALTSAGDCYLMADMLGTAVVWFVVLPYPASADRASLPPIELLLNDVTEAELTNGWILPLAGTVDRSSFCKEDTTSLTNFVRKFGDQATTILDVAKGEIIAVGCPDDLASTDTTTTAAADTTVPETAPPG